MHNARAFASDHLLYARHNGALMIIGYALASCVCVCVFLCWILNIAIHAHTHTRIVPQQYGNINNSPDAYNKAHTHAYTANTSTLPHNFEHHALLTVRKSTSSFTRARGSVVRGASEKSSGLLRRRFSDSAREPRVRAHNDPCTLVCCTRTYAQNTHTHART